MSYRDQLRQASFRGVPFGIESVSSEGGRRLAVHQYPKSDQWTVEDTGGLPRRFSFESFIVGDDYLQVSDRLIAALGVEGPGLLVHPFGPEIFVQVAGYGDRLTGQEGGMARFSINFVLSDQFLAIYPQSARSFRAAVDTAAGVVVQRAAETAEQTLELEGVPETVRESAASELEKIGLKIAELDVFSGPAREAAELGQLVAGLINRAKELAVSPAVLVSTLLETGELILASASSERAASSAYEALAFLSPNQTGSKVSTGQQADAAARITIDLIKQIALAKASAIAAEVDWETLEEATEAQRRISDAIARAMESSTPEVYEELVSLRAALSDAVPPQDRKLPRLVQVIPQATTNALTLAYEQYGDASRAPEIIARNPRPQPGFYLGGEPVEVVINA